MKRVLTALLLALLVVGCDPAPPRQYDETWSEWYEVYNLDDHPYRDGYREVTLKRLVNGEIYANIRVNGQPRPGVAIGDTITLIRGSYKRGGDKVEEFVNLESRFTLPAEPEAPKVPNRIPTSPSGAID